MPIRLTQREPVGDAWLMLHQTYDSIIKCEESTLAEFSLPVQQYLVLRVIKYAPDPVNSVVVSNWLDRNHNSISSIVDRMEKAGYLKRVKNVNDRRSAILIITPKGETLYRKTCKTAEELPKKVLSVLTEKELKSLLRLLHKIRENTFEIRHIKDKVSNVTLTISKKRTKNNLAE